MAKLKGRGDQFGPKHKLDLKITVRASGSIAGPFRACVFPTGPTPHYKTDGCGDGRNPRMAVAAALRQFASRVAKRHGAFAGVGGQDKGERKGTPMAKQKSTKQKSQAPHEGDYACALPEGSKKLVCGKVEDVAGRGAAEIALRLSQKKGGGLRKVEGGAIRFVRRAK